MVSGVPGPVEGWSRQQSLHGRTPPGQCVGRAHLGQVWKETCPPGYDYHQHPHHRLRSIL